MYSVSKFGETVCSQIGQGGVCHCLAMGMFCQQDNIGSHIASEHAVLSVASYQLYPG